MGYTMGPSTSKHGDAWVTLVSGESQKSSSIGATPVSQSLLLPIKNISGKAKVATVELREARMEPNTDDQEEPT